jgi:hypothetical protein
LSFLCVNLSVLSVSAVTARSHPLNRRDAEYAEVAQRKLKFSFVTADARSSEFRQRAETEPVVPETIKSTQRLIDCKDIGLALVGGEKPRKY